MADADELPLAIPGVSMDQAHHGYWFTMLRAAVLGSRGELACGSNGPRRSVYRLGQDAVYGTAPLPLLAPSHLSHRISRTIHQRRHQSSYPSALHPTPALSVAVDTSSPASSGVPYHFEPYGLAQRRRSNTRLPTPLPPDVTARKSAAFRKHVKSQQSSAREVDRPTYDKEGTTPDTVVSPPPPSFGDLSTASLQSLNRNDAFFTPSQTVENLAILRACLSTDLTLRASKIFHGIREECRNKSMSISNWASSLDATSSDNIDTSSLDPKVFNPMDIKFYNAMLGSFMRKAWQEEDKVRTGQWLNKAWQLLEEMEGDRMGKFSSSADPRPDQETYAIMAKGLGRLMRNKRLPSTQPNYNRLLPLIRRRGYTLHDVLFSNIFTQEQDAMEYFGGVNTSREGEPDAKAVLHLMGPVVSELRDAILSSEVDEVGRVFQGLDKRAMEEAITNRSRDLEQGEQVPELRPVLPSNKKVSHISDEADDIQYNLKILRENLSIVQEAKQSSSDPYERQNWLEFGALDAARKRFTHGLSMLENLGLHNAGNLKQKDLQKWMWKWYKNLTIALQDDIKLIQEAEEKKTPLRRGGIEVVSTLEIQLLPFLRLLPPERLAMIAILELMRLQGTGGVTDGMKTASALVNIGKAVEREHYSDVLRKNPDRLAKAKATQSTLYQGGITSMNVRKSLQTTMDKDDNLQSAATSDWSTNIRARVGSFLVQHLMNVATVKCSAMDRDGVYWDEDQPAFYSAYQYIQGKRLGVIRLNEIVSKRLARESPLVTLQARHLPMLVPPRPWLRYDSGGYYSIKTRALRYKDDFEQGSYLKSASEDGSLEYVLAGLDVLGSTAWTINKDIFKVMSEVWNSGKSLADVPPLELEEEEPTRPNDYDTNIKARGIFLQSMRHHNLKKLSVYGQRCEVNYKLEIARAYVGERFYFPHNMDFRGRAYPLPPLLNHIGNDLSRGLLLFADSKPLGSVGLRWLRIHLANVFGFDKASFSEREKFAIDHEDVVRQSVADPLEKGDWWLKADDPWQCLATCMELVKALDHPEGPEMFKSCLPVHQDGTCNGLQHYAALGGDIAGAEQVNLRGGDRPSDVYTAVADLVIEVVERDARAGMESAKLVQGKITRKVVKQTVMTTVYGVTFIGAKDQVSRQLKERGLASEHLWTCSSYLARQIMTCIGNLFSGAEAIQNWLSESALLIAKSIPPERIQDVDLEAKDSRSSARVAKQMAKEQMTSVIWTTPLGLPVVQPYRKIVRKQVATSMQSLFIQDPNMATQVSPKKQASAFPPNFIHSLDATHMFLTALECQSAKLTFASVHDSYWTHACDIETMSDIIRDTFVRLHSCDILDKLLEEFTSRYQGHVVPVLAVRDIVAKREKRKRGLQSTLSVETQDRGEKASPLATDVLQELSSREGAVEAARAVVSEEGLTALPEETDTQGTEKLTSAAKTIERRKRGTACVPLQDVLSKIPKKGGFDVNEIKVSTGTCVCSVPVERSKLIKVDVSPLPQRSLYFFS